MGPASEAASNSGRPRALAATRSELEGARVDVERHPLQLLSLLLSDHDDDLVVGDVLVVVPEGCLRGRCEDRLRQQRAVLEARGQAVAADPAHPEAYNLLGALLEIKGDWVEAQKFYRAALDIDPTFKPARENLDRTTSWFKFGKIDLGPDNGDAKAKEDIDKEDQDEK